MAETKREVKDSKAVARAVNTDDLSEGKKSLEEWLKNYVVENGANYLLAHADDGVIWGKIEGDKQTGYKLKTSRGSLEGCILKGKEIEAALKVCPELRLKTLQQARLFSGGAELLLWRADENYFQARVIEDEGRFQAWLAQSSIAEDQAQIIDRYSEAIDEEQILWGTDGMLLQPSYFTLMSDGAQGLRHVVPLNAEGAFGEKSRPLRLLVRHYVKEDATGFTRITVSRLVGLRAESKKEKTK